jgi:nitroreductase
MDITDGILHRKSVRGFKTDPVPKEILEAILEVAKRAPSATNGQPWEAALVTREPLEEIKRGNIENLTTGVIPNPEIRGNLYEGVYKQRQVDIAAQLYGIMGIARDDKRARDAWGQRGYRFYDAPVVVIVFLIVP